MAASALNFKLSEEQTMMKETIALLVKNSIAGNAHAFDENRTIPAETLQKIWDLGIPASVIPEEFGGYGMESSPVMNAIILEELSAGDMAFAIASTLPLLFAILIKEIGSKAQKEKFFPVLTGPKFISAAPAVNEMRFGFDAGNLLTHAVKIGSEYILNGEKCFVPMAKESEFLIVTASIKGVNSLFIVEKNTAGVNIGDREKNLGLYALPTYTVTFSDCRIPEENILGEPGISNRIFLQRSRSALSAIGTGVCRAAYEYARAYAKDRSQFGEPIASRQSIAFMIAEMAIEVDAMRLMTWKAASTLEHKKDAWREAFLARRYAGEACMKLTDYGVQILGGHGYVRDHPVERYYRNGRSIAILEGMVLI